ncbi:MAG: DUF1573 domain-containing protein [Bacteroidales bacterium]|nr:DUF1573 domain-containing protein [Bacteroidales bacterium]
MKKIILIIPLVFMIGFISMAQSSHDGASAASIKFDKEVYDYGTIKQYADASCQFTFKNNGNEPLVITKVITSCGCTVPDYPKSPIMPGQEGQIQVTYDSSKLGSINNQIVVRTNAEEGTVILKIKGKVVRK